MTSTTASASPATAGAGLPLPVLGAAACFALGAGSAAALVNPGNVPLDVAVPLGWATFALGAAVLLDRGTEPRLARAMAALALVPPLVVALAAVRPTDGAQTLPALGVRQAFGPGAIAAAFAVAAAPQAVAVLVGLPVAARPAGRPALRRALVAVAVAGALAVTVSGPGPVRWTGWTATALGSAGVWLDILLGARGEGRVVRRRTAWLVLSLALTALAAAVAALVLERGPAQPVIAGLLALQAVTTTRIVLHERFRPLDEHLLDVALVAGALAVTAAAVGLLRLATSLGRTPSSESAVTVGAVLTAAAAVPAALRVRRAVLARRYGPGVIAPSDVAVITEDLHARADPRDLLDKAARMVAAASGCRDARLVLGPDVPDVPPHWTAQPLTVGDERVGTLVVEAAGPDGLEPRQAEDVARLVPTVALVARAVTLAVEAELSRRDVARERDLERKRILADLHDGLGPALAGMSMRVKAALRAGAGAGPQDPQARQRLLADLADALTTSRADLRRLVSGITPSALDGGDLGAALDELVGSFRGFDGPTVSLAVALDGEPPRDVGVTVYRCVAEGVTNALRHARASAIRVSVSSSGAGGVTVTVTDDGTGGAVVPGVGLSSLRARAEALGGALTVTPGPAGGTTLRLRTPGGARMSA